MRIHAVQTQNTQTRKTGGNDYMYEDKDHSDDQVRLCSFLAIEQAAGEPLRCE